VVEVELTSPAFRHIAAACVSAASRRTWEINMRIAALFLSACTALAFAACTTSPPAAPTAGPAPVMTGAYGAADLNNEDVKAAQAIAVNAIYTRNPTRALVEKVNAETQVVAGFNYRFNIVMTGGTTYRIVVFRSLQGEMSVTSYEKTA
jgi:hypothetical protein